jgi:hypothetical protein
LPPVSLAQLAEQLTLNQREVAEKHEKINISQDCAALGAALNPAHHPPVGKLPAPSIEQAWPLLPRHIQLSILDLISAGLSQRLPEASREN